jgi:hypothetical protein
MKKKIGIFAIVVASLFVATDIEASQTTLHVTDVKAINKDVTKYDYVPYQEEVCYVYRRNSRGVLEKIVDNGFGSTSGMVGTGVGVAIVDELGGNDAAKIIGGLLGNKIGNDISEKKNKDKNNCELVTKHKRQAYTETIVDHYRVTGTLGDVIGPVATVRRNFEPMLGDEIRVNVKVW